MSRCYYCATTKTTCPACTRRALEQDVIDAAVAWYRDDWPDDEHEPTVRLNNAVRAYLDGGAGSDL